MAWAPDSSHVASIGHDGKVCIFQIVSGDPPRLGRYLFLFHPFLFEHDDILNLGVLAGVREFVAHSGLGKGVAWDPTNRYIASIGDDKKVLIHRADNGEFVTRISKYFQKSSEYHFSCCWGPSYN